MQLCLYGATVNCKRPKNTKPANNVRGLENLTKYA